MVESLVKLVKEEDFDSFLQNNKLVLVKFSAEWCGPCKSLQVNIDKLLKEMEQSENQPKDLVVLEVDAEKFPQLVSKELNLVLSIRSVPTFFLFHQGKMIKEGQGNRSIEWLRQFITV